MKYEVKWSDGNAAASRGGAPDERVDTTVECDPKDIWTVLRLMKYTGYLGDINGGLEDPEFKEEIFDYFGVDSYDPDDEDLSPFLKTTQKTFENCNMDDIDDGDPWVLSVTDGSGNVLYECNEGSTRGLDYDEAYDYLKYVLRIPHEGAEQILDDLDEYTYPALEAAAFNFKCDDQNDLSPSLTEAKGTLTGEEIENYLRNRGFSAEVVKIVIEWFRRGYAGASCTKKRLEKAFNTSDPAAWREGDALLALLHMMDNRLGEEVQKPNDEDEGALTREKLKII